MRDPPNRTEMSSFSRKLLEGNIFHGKKWPSEHFENAFQTPFVLMQLRGCQVELPTFGGAQRGRIHAVGEWTVRQGCFIIFIMRLQVKVIKKTSPVSIITGCWFQICFIFTPKIGEDEPSLTIIFANGWFNHQPDQDVEKGMIKFPPFLWPTGPRSQWLGVPAMRLGTWTQGIPCCVAGGGHHRMRVLAWY